MQRRKKSGQNELQAANKILDQVWERTYSKYEAFKEIDEEYKLEDSLTYDLEAVLASYVKARKVPHSIKLLTLSEIKVILKSIVEYNKKHKDVILVTDDERSDLTSLVGFAFS